MLEAVPLREEVKGTRCDDGVGSADSGRISEYYLLLPAFCEMNAANRLNAQHCIDNYFRIIPEIETLRKENPFNYGKMRKQKKSHGTPHLGNVNIVKYQRRVQDEIIKRLTFILR